MKLDPKIFSPPNGRHVRVMVVDGEPMSRLAWRHCIEPMPGFLLCAEAETIAVAEVLRVQCEVDVVVIDPDLDGGGGWQFLRRLKQESAPIACLVWLRGTRAATVAWAMRAGACAVSLRSEPREELIAALTMTAAGLRYVSDRASQLLSEGIATGSIAEVRAPFRLPTRQEQVFRMLGEGFATREIASKLGVSLKTVQTHVGRLKLQLGAHSQAALRRQAMVADTGELRRRLGV